MSFIFQIAYKKREIITIEKKNKRIQLFEKFSKRSSGEQCESHHSLLFNLTSFKHNILALDSTCKPTKKEQDFLCNRDSQNISKS